MSNLQVKNVPLALARRLREIARREDRTIRDIVVEAVQREVQRRTFVGGLKKRPRVTLQTSAAALLSAERAERELEPE